MGKRVLAGDQKTEKRDEQTVVRTRVLIGGLVQGVGFRAYTQRQAQQGRLSGWVRNLPDGRVETEVQGSRPAIDAFVAALRKGPYLSRVDTIEIEWMEVGGQDTGFHILD